MVKYYYKKTRRGLNLMRVPASLTVLKVGKGKIRMQTKSGQLGVIHTGYRMVSKSRLKKMLR